MCWEKKVELINVESGQTRRRAFRNRLPDRCSGLVLTLLSKHLIRLRTGKVIFNHLLLAKILPESFPIVNGVKRSHLVTTHGGPSWNCILAAAVPASVVLFM